MCTLSDRLFRSREGGSRLAQRHDVLRSPRAHRRRRKEYGAGEILAQFLVQLPPTFQTTEIDISALRAREHSALVMFDFLTDDRILWMVFESGAMYGVGVQTGRVNYFHGCDSESSLLGRTSDATRVAADPRRRMEPETGAAHRRVGRHALQGVV